MKTRTRLILAGALAVTALVVVAFVANLYLQRQALLREIAAWEAAGLPLDPMALYPPGTPEGEQLARAFIDLMAGVDEKLPHGGIENAEAYIHTYGTDEELATMQAGESPWIVVADHFAADIDKLRELLGAETPWSWSASLLESDMSPGPLRVYDAGTLLLIEARAQADRGDGAAAAANLEAALRLSENAVLFPGSSGVYWHFLVDGQVLETLSEIAQVQPIPIQGIERRLQQRDYRAVFVRGLKARAAQIWMMRDSWLELLPDVAYDYDPTLGRFSIERHAARYFADMREVLDRMAVPYADQEDPGWEPECPEGWPFHRFIWGLRARNARAADAEALRCMALFAFEFEREKEASGDLEATIMEMEHPRLGRQFLVYPRESGLRIELYSAWRGETLEWKWTFHD